MHLLLAGTFALSLFSGPPPVDLGTAVQGIVVSPGLTSPAPSAPFDASVRFVTSPTLSLVLEPAPIASVEKEAPRSGSQRGGPILCCFRCCEPPPQ